MPVKSCTIDGKKGYKWGSDGHCYTYEEDNEGQRRKAKKNALMQGLASGALHESKVSIKKKKDL